MRFGTRRETACALALVATVALGLASAAHADGWRLHPTLPGEVPAYNFTTGGEFMAPPVPYGHYAKDPLGEVDKHVGILKGHLGGLGGLFHKGGSGCGHGDGGGCSSGHGWGGSGGGCGFCFGKGLFHHGDDCGSGHSGLGHGLGHKKHFAPCHSSTVVATSQAQPAPQVVVGPSAQNLCADPGCKIFGKHKHLGGLLSKLHCRSCGGSGCGNCGGSGLCGNCGGKGCGNCLSGLGSKAHGLLGSLTGLLHQQKIDYFVGPGGPVPLTPGYVPYIVTTRSPRDFFAFPPMNPNDP